jgi:hydroxybutyrate-dimer hydrolase
MRRRCPAGAGVARANYREKTMQAYDKRLGAWAVAAVLAAWSGGEPRAAAGPGQGDHEAASNDAQRAKGESWLSPFNRLPAFIEGPVHVAEYDGAGDDLLTGGLGKAGLTQPLPPFANPAAPTAAELRRAALYNNYRAIVDVTAAGGYGTLYGPNVAADGTVTAGDGKVAGAEYIAYSRGAEGPGAPRQNVVLMVQVPATFDPYRPCIVTATSSGSRGVYGAISVGEWGLKRGCAVAYNDKGTGTAPHDLMNDTVALIDGTRVAAATAGETAHFRAGLTEAERQAFDASTPNRFAFKHAHSRRNPEKDWGRFTLQAVEFAFWVLNERHGIALPNGQRVRTVRPENTLVIASSLSNGGGAAIAAAELDRDGLIDGVAVSEPVVEMPVSPGVVVQRGGTTPPTIGKTLFDYTSLSHLYQSCAALSPQVADAPGVGLLVKAFATNRCASLRAKGLLTADTPQAQADEALARLAQYGWEPEAAPLHASLAGLEVVSAVAVTYGQALSRAGVADGLCGYSFAATAANGAVTTLDPLLLAAMAGTGNGVPPSAGVQIVNDRNPGGAIRNLVSSSPSTLTQDFNLDGALCLRDLLTGTDAHALALQQGIDETRRVGDLHGRPAIIVHGRADALIPVNHTSRPYTALNKRVEGWRSRLSYVEVTNAQHFDAFIGLPTVLPGYDTRYVPLHLYLIRALDAMWDHLRHGAPLPPSQVVRTVPRGGTPGAAPALTADHVPPIAARPAAGDVITVRGHTLLVPD